MTEKEATMFPVKKKSLGECAVDLERLCTIIDSMEDPDAFNEKLITEFEDVKNNLAVKVDNVINYVDGLKFMISALKEKKERISKAYKTAQNVEKRIKDYIKWVLSENPKLPFSGEQGTLYLHKSPPGTKINFATTDVRLNGVVTDIVREGNPAIEPYLKKHVYYTIDKNKIKADLKAGMKLGWAELTNDSHVRVKG